MTNVINIVLEDDFERRIRNRKYVDDCYEDFKKVCPECDTMNDRSFMLAFNGWLWENYRAKWLGGDLYFHERLIFEDERFMAMFMLRYS